MLLSGSPGTGKSAYARYRAERAGIDLVCISGSELLGAFVGETEKQIAAAFANAERNGSLLLIDEADSFLANRDLAHRNWEVSMTNEMLRLMERSRVRFIATTNRAATLGSTRRVCDREERTVNDGAIVIGQFDKARLGDKPAKLNKLRVRSRLVMACRQAGECCHRLLQLMAQSEPSVGVRTCTSAIACR